MVAATHIDKVKRTKRETIKVPLTAALVKSLVFQHWPVSPLRWNGHRLVTEPTPPQIKDWIIRDTVTRGLGVRVTPGAKSYFVQRKRKGSTSDRYVLTQQQSLADARIQAADWYTRMAAGENPTQTIKSRAQAEAKIRAAKTYTFGLAFADFVADGEARVEALTLRPASLRDRKAVVRWMQESDLWATPLADVDQAQVKATFVPLFAEAERTRRKRRLQDEDTPRKRGGLASDIAAVHKVLTYCGTAWNFAIGLKAETNPFAEWKKTTRLPKVVRRQTVLATESDAGVAWLCGLDGCRNSKDPVLAMVADYVLLAVLWGGRKSELAEIRWGDINFSENWARFAAETTKANEDHYLPLTSWGVDILRARQSKNRMSGWSTKRGDRVFPHPRSKTGAIEDYRTVIRALHKQTGLWIRLHDLRRTLATSVFGSVKDLGTVSIALGHSSEKDVTRDYVQRLAALAALRELYTAREKRLRQLIGLDQTPTTEPISEYQRAMLDTARALLKQAGLDALPPEEIQTPRK